MIWAGLYFHGGDFGTLARSLVPKVAFALLPSKGKLYVEAEAASEGEHLEGVEALKADQAAFTEDSRSYWRDKPRFVFLNEKVKYTIPYSTARLQKSRLSKDCSKSITVGNTPPISTFLPWTRT